MICSVQQTSHLWHLLSISPLNSDEEMVNVTWQFQVGNFCINLWPNLKCDLNVLALAAWILNYSKPCINQKIRNLARLQLGKTEKKMVCYNWSHETVNAPVVINHLFFFFFHFGSDRRALTGVLPCHMSPH